MTINIINNPCYLNDEIAEHPVAYFLAELSIIYSLNKRRILLVGLGLFVALSTILSADLYGQKLMETKTLKNSFTGIGIHSSIGLANFSVRSTLVNRMPIFTTQAGIQARYFITPRLAFQHSVDYLSLGADYKSPQDELKMRLRCLQIGINAQYFISLDQSKPVLSVQGGVFAGYILESVQYYYNAQYNQSGHNRPIGTFTTWNGGLTLGLELHNLMPHLQPLSIALQHDIGLFNLAASTTPAGSRCFTRFYYLTLYYTFLKP